jgi:VanZ family protein
MSWIRGPSARRFFRWGLALCILAVSALAFAPLPAPPLTGTDKADHILAFTVLAALAAGAYPGRQRLLARSILLLAYGAFIEVVQYFLPYRESSLLDLTADAAGILLFSALAILIRQTLLREARKPMEEGP